MLENLLPFSALLAVSFVVACYLLRWSSDTDVGSKKFVLVVLGSGGHTTEMLYMIKSLEAKSDKIKYIFIVADSDHTSVARILPILGLDFPLDSEIVHVRRIRHVGEPFLHAFLRIPLVLIETAFLLKRFRPHLVLVNGPGTCVPIVALSWFFGGRSCQRVFVESFCRVNTLSTSGRLVYRLVNRFFLQWPPSASVQTRFPGATYLGGPLVL